MYKLSRENVLKTAKWGTGELSYIEAWSYSNIYEASPATFRAGTLKDHEIGSWLAYREAFSIPEPISSAGDLKGGIRLLLCNRTSMHPLRFSFSKASYETIEAEFHLHPATLSTFELDSGTYSRHVINSSTDPSTIKRISILLKAPQKYEIANYGLSLSHDVASGMTTALLYGENMFSGDSSTSRPNSPAKQIQSLLKDAVEHWSDPLLLPCAVMTDHLSRTQTFCSGDLTEEVMGIEDQLGVITVGRRNTPASYLWKHWLPPSTGTTTQPFDQQAIPASLSRAKAGELTVKINTLYTKILFAKRSPVWNCEASEFLVGLLSTSSPLTDHSLVEVLQHNIARATSVSDHVINLQARMELQLSVLYSFVAQTDNRLSAELAAASGQDSTSMKILAFITALFLPGTFIATLFSMGMFNWHYDAKASDSTEPGVLSSRFWIYWATALPLTVVTLVGWGLWWRIDRRRFDLNRIKAREATEPERSLRRILRMKEQ